MQVAAKVTEAAVDAARVAYAPAGDFAAQLFFCISDLAAIDPMYQYSLPWCVAVSHELGRELVTWILNNISSAIAHCYSWLALYRSWFDLQ